MRLRVAGTPGHGSMPYGSDNALVTAAEVVRRLVAIRPQPQLGDLWQALVASLDIPAELAETLDRPAARRRGDRLARRRPRADRPRLHAHDDLAERRPRRAEDEHDSRCRRPRGRHPHRSRRHDRHRPQLSSWRPSASWRRGWRSACCSTASRHARRPTTSCGTSSARQTQVAYPGAELVPGLIVGGTDARFYRRRGTVAYGAALFSPGVTFESFGQRFHGNDERIDVDSLGLCGDFFYGVSSELLS